MPLARGMKLQEFIELCMQRGWLGYLQLALDFGLAGDAQAEWTEVMEVWEVEAEVSFEIKDKRLASCR